MFRVPVSLPLRPGFRSSSNSKEKLRRHARISRKCKNLTRTSVALVLNRASDYDGLPKTRKGQLSGVSGSSKSIDNTAAQSNHTYAPAIKDTISTLFHALESRWAGIVGRFRDAHFRIGFQLQLAHLQIRARLVNTPRRESKNQPQVRSNLQVCFSNQFFSGELHIARRDGGSIGTKKEPGFTAKRCIRRPRVNES
ncbi:hypothetical protein NP233_g11544 [Leucocoprinus birnbaumii]|uniref:Uncharacterized protein n=1 Tax=Leucocoprinus birnbaumii TaxID=56174 RepID=A0AAD5YL73_9AGAR|nr:hypothetical protein NP233_g11544 [Leucocoprinus birnbaumii]